MGKVQAGILGFLPFHFSSSAGILSSGYWWWLLVAMYGLPSKLIDSAKRMDMGLVILTGDQVKCAGGFQIFQHFFHGLLPIRFKNRERNNQFAFTSSRPIKTPMTDAIISPRVQPEESPRQWKFSILVRKCSSIFTRLL